MARMPLWCGPLGAGGEAGMSQQLLVGTCVDSRSMRVGLRGRAVGRWRSPSSLAVGGQGDSWDLQGQATQDLGTTQEAVSPPV